MEYRPLGRTGVQVSELCFGTMSFGGDADEAASAAMYAAGLDAGINFFDTRRHVQRRGVRTHPRAPHEGAPRRPRGRDEVLQPAGGRPQRLWRVPPPRDEGRRGEPPPARHRPGGRPLPPPVRPAHPHRRADAGARGPRPLRQGALPGGQQLRRLADPRRALGAGAPRLVAPRSDRADVQPRQAPGRGRDPADGRGPRDRGHPLQPGRRRPPLRQVRGRGRGRRREPAPHQPDVPGALRGGMDARRRPAVRVVLPRAGASPGGGGGRVGGRASRRHRPDHRRARPRPAPRLARLGVDRHDPGPPGGDLRPSPAPRRPRPTVRRSGPDSPRAAGLFPRWRPLRELCARRARECERDTRALEGTRPAVPPTVRDEASLRVGRRATSADTVRSARPSAPGRLSGR